MKYKLKIYDIWELGRREKQEDSIFPEYGKAQDSDRLFVLCDGMGGHDAGEVASGTVCAAMAASVSEHCPEPEGAFSDEDFAEALDDAFNALDKKDTGAAKKMGTTLTFLKFHDKGCTIAHMGDSRVYHIRPGKSADDTGILFQTVDHSLVNDLVKVGELTPEEARHSNQKNVITRAMQPNMSKRPKADLYHTSDIKPGDYFMLCSDGMLEQMEDDNLRYIFSDKGGDAPHKVEMLKKVTAQNRDNHSAIIVHVTDVTDVADAADTADIPADRDVSVRDVPEKSQSASGKPSVSSEQSPVASEQSPAASEQSPVSSEQSSDVSEQSGKTAVSPLFRRLRWAIIFVIIVLLAFVGYNMFRHKPDEDNGGKSGRDRTEQVQRSSRPARPAAPAHSADPSESGQVSDSPEQSDHSSASSGHAASPGSSAPSGSQSSGDGNPEDAVIPESTEEASGDDAVPEDVEVSDDAASARRLVEDAVSAIRNAGAADSTDNEDIPSSDTDTVLEQVEQ